MALVHEAEQVGGDPGDVQARTPMPRPAAVASPADGDLSGAVQAGALEELGHHVGAVVRPHAQRVTRVVFERAFRQLYPDVSHVLVGARAAEMRYCWRLLCAAGCAREYLGCRSVVSIAGWTQRYFWLSAAATRSVQACAVGFEVRLAGRTVDHAVRTQMLQTGIELAGEAAEVGVGGVAEAQHREVQ